MISCHAARNPQDPRAAQARPPTPAHVAPTVATRRCTTRRAPLATFRLSWAILCQTFSMGPRSPEKLRNLAAMNQVPSFGSGSHVFRHVTHGFRGTVETRSPSTEPGSAGAFRVLPCAGATPLPPRHALVLQRCILHAGQCKALASRSSPTLPRSMPRLWKARRSSSPPSVRACAWALRRPACQTRSPTA